MVHSTSRPGLARSTYWSTEGVFPVTAEPRHKPGRMFPSLDSAALALLHRLGPEHAHDLALWGLRLGLVRASHQADDPILATNAFGLHFANPIGLAAGFDKNAVAIVPLFRLGFGFVETGTVTPRPQYGNPRPRLFRLDADRAAINRMGFNNHGLMPYLSNVARRPRGLGVLGCNVGINKDNAEPLADYPALVEAVAPHADYVVINVSSPNTPGLRDLQGETRLRGILRAVAARVRSPPPILVKVSPDLSDEDLIGVVEASVTGGASGLIVSNTTAARPAGLHSAAADQTGGLSGTPLFDLSTAMLARAFLLARGRLTLVGVGGVSSGMDALIKIRAGASLVQLFTSLIFKGPHLIPRLKHELAVALRADGCSDLRQLIGIDAARFAKSA
jgi:dihydroorotate dehydrogenase